MAQAKGNVCVADFKALVGDYLSDEDAQWIIDEVKRRAKARMEKRLMKRADALKMSIDELLEERKFNEQVARRQSFLAIKKRIAGEQQINAFKNKAKGTFAFFGGIESNIPNSRVSVVSQMLQDNFSAKSYFLNMLYKDDVKKVFDDLKIGPDLARALWDKEAKVSPEIRKVANIIKKINEHLVKQLNREGASIKIVDDYIARLVHNRRKLISATGFGLKDAQLRASLMIKHRGDYDAVNHEYAEIAYERWKNFTFPKLDQEKTFERTPKDEEEEFMRSVYEATVTGIHKVPYTEEGHPMISRLNTNYGKRWSQQRVLHWKDGQSWEAYNKEFGYGSVQDAIISQIDQMSRSLGVMKRLGTSPRVFAERLIRKMQQKARDIGDIKGNEKFFKNTKNVLNAILGDEDRVPEGLLGHLINGMRTFSYLVKMGHITLASIPDLNNMTSAMKMHSVPHMEVIQTALANLAKGLPKGEMRELALNLGVYSDGSIGTLLNKFGNVDTPYGLFAKAMKLNDKLIGINRWDSMNRFTMGYLLSKNLAGLLDKDFEALPFGEQRTLRISGVNSAMWKLFQANRDKLTRVNRISFLSPEIMDEISDDSIQSIMSPDVKLSPASMTRLRQTIKDRLGIYFTDQTAYGKIFPNESDMALMNFGINKNTLPGQIWRLLTMFKSFHVASFRRTIGRFLYSHGADNVYDAIFRGKADFKGMMDYMINSLPWGYISYAAQNLSYGLLPPDLTDKKTWIESSLRGGLIPLWGSLLMNAYENGGGLSSIFGPGFEGIKEIKDVLTQIASGKNPKVQATWLLEKNIPYLHTFWYDLVLRRAFLDGINEKVDPTYQYKQTLRAQKNNETYYWAPS